MSLATLKSKIELLIHKATFGNIYEKIFKNEPLDLIIPDGVTSICENLSYSPLTVVSCTGADVEEITENFFQNSGIQTVNLPKTKVINNDAFYQCSSLTEINMPLVTTVGNVAFYQCSSLTEINMPLVTTVGNEAFYLCSSLTEINMPSLTSIGLSAIYGTTNLTKMTVGVLENADPTSFKQTARGSTSALTELYVGAGTRADLYLQYSTKYTQATLHKIIENLYDLSNGGMTGILCVGAKNLEKIDDEHKAMAENKNWELS